MFICKKGHTKDAPRAVEQCCVETASIMEMRVGWNDMGYMDGSYNENVREVEDENGLFRSVTRQRF